MSIAVRGNPGSSSEPLIAVPSLSAPDDASSLLLDALPQDGLAAVFGVHFHTTKGNTLEFFKGKPGVDVSLLEFRAMPSGLHSVESDVIFFRQGELHGVACFHRMRTQEADQRNARMRYVPRSGSSLSGFAEHRLVIGAWAHSSPPVGQSCVSSSRCSRAKQRGHMPRSLHANAIVPSPSKTGMSAGSVTAAVYKLVIGPHAMCGGQRGPELQPARALV